MNKNLVKMEQIKIHRDKLKLCTSLQSLGSNKKEKKGGKKREGEPKERELEEHFLISLFLSLLFLSQLHIFKTKNLFKSLSVKENNFRSTL